MPLGLARELLFVVVVVLVRERQIQVKVGQGHGEALSSICLSVYTKVQRARSGSKHNLQSDVFENVKHLLPHYENKFMRCVLSSHYKVSPNLTHQTFGLSTSFEFLTDSVCI